MTIRMSALPLARFCGKATEIGVGSGRAAAMSTAAGKKRGIKPMSVGDYIDLHTCYEALSGCLLWTGPRDMRGYGDARARACGKQRKAHRLVWEYHHGPIPDGMLIRHHCDNPACVNVDHLALGNDADNVADMYARGRASRGDKHATKLCTADVIAIRADNRTVRVIAAQYNVSYSMVSAIKLNRRWSHI